MSDQAAALRRAMRRHETVGAGAGEPATAVIEAPAPAERPEAPSAPPRLARTIAICSGKGGVGKSNVAVNLAAALSGLDLKVCLMDADLGMANADVLCNLAPRMTLEHVLRGRCRLVDVALLAPGGFRLIPGASGVSRLADLDGRRRRGLLEQLAALEKVADILVIDTGAGISSNVLGFALAAHSVLAVTTPEPPAMTDCYGLIKALTARRRGVSIQLIVNMAADEAEGRSVAARMDRVCRTFLGRGIHHAATIPRDRSVMEAVEARVPFVLYAPHGAATGQIRQLARLQAGLEPTGASRGRRSGFIGRLSTWFG